MTIQVLQEKLTVCKVKDYSLTNLANPFTFTGKTDNENSLVCPTSLTPENTTVVDNGWVALRVKGSMEFALIGILSKISTILANNGISIFAISTFDTDYILLNKSFPIFRTIEITRKALNSDFIIDLIS